MRKNNKEIAKIRLQYFNQKSSTAIYVRKNIKVKFNL